MAKPLEKGSLTPHVNCVSINRRSSEVILHTSNLEAQRTLFVSFVLGLDLVNLTKA